MEIKKCIYITVPKVCTCVDYSNKKKYCFYLSSSHTLGVFEGDDEDIKINENNSVELPQYRNNKIYI
jgi:hypothetical protein